MQKSDLKDFCFFQNKDGSFDEMAMALSCIEATVYNILKNTKTFDKDIIFPLFLKDIYPTLWCNTATGVFRMTNITSSISSLWHKYIRLIQYVKKQDKDSIHFLESLLDQGQMVILQTAFQRLKYYIEYDPEFDLSTYNQEINHANIILFHEDDKIYFVEKQPYRINKENFVPYKLNSQIGVVLKSELEEATNYFFRCYTLEIDKEELKDSNSLHRETLNLIHSISEKYIGSNEHVDGYSRYYGIAALEKLIGLCDEGADLNKYYAAPGTTIQDRIAFDIWMMHGSRQILMEYLILEKNRRTCPEGMSVLMDTLLEAITQWKLLERILSRLIKSKSTLLNPKIGNRIKNIIEIENRLNVLLRNYA